MRTGRTAHGCLPRAILVLSLDAHRKLCVRHHFAPSAADERLPASCGGPLSGRMAAEVKLYGLGKETFRFFGVCRTAGCNGCDGPHVSSREGETL
jgi:hypothetical protein